MQKLTISDNRRYLTYADGSPFFWLGDTAWELFHKLDREEAAAYMRQRASLGFNVIQAVALAELDGLTTDNAYGRRPLLQDEQGTYDPCLPDVSGEYSYWDHVDYIVDEAASLGLYIAMLPTWGDKFHLKHGTGPVIFDERNAGTYGRWIGERYKDRSNLIWVMGGDRGLIRYEHFAVVRAMAEGVRAGDSGHKLMTFHPQGWQSSSHHVHDEPWLDFNMIQSGHGNRMIMNYKFVDEDYKLEPVKPTFDAEPCYEDIPIGFNPENGYFDEADVRTAAYYGVFSGGFGHTYGHHSIWAMVREPGDSHIMDWRTGMERPGASQMQHMRALMESRPFLERVPEQGLIADNRPGANYIVATRGEGYAMLYTPNGLPLRVVMERLPGEEVRASWYDPRTGSYSDAGVMPNRDRDVTEFRPPTSGRGQDWVLVLDSLMPRNNCTNSN